MNPGTGVAAAPSARNIRSGIGFARQDRSRRFESVAALRLPACVSVKPRRLVEERAIQGLVSRDAADSVVKGALRKENAANPHRLRTHHPTPILALDEPTSDHDAFTAFTPFQHSLLSPAVAAQLSPVCNTLVQARLQLTSWWCYAGEMCCLWGRLIASHITRNPAGGVKLISGAKGITLDNTLDERLRLLEDRMLTEIRVYLFGGNENRKFYP